MKSEFERFKKLILSLYDIPNIIDDNFINEALLKENFSRWGLCYRDLSDKDLSKLSSRKLWDIKYDTTTIWPINISHKLNPHLNVELGKKVGFGIDKLHEMGINGLDINIAIIDFPFNINHIEFKDRIVEYNVLEEVPREHFHGITVSSLFVGNNVGVAPKAKLYFYAVNGGDILHISEKVIEALRSIYEHNLKDKNKISVVSFSGSIEDSYNTERNKYIRLLKDQGCAFIDSPTFGEHFTTSKRTFSDDINNLENNELNDWQKEKEEYFKKRILVPGGGRTSALIFTKDQYIYHGQSSYSWSIPMLSGIYTLALQVNPKLTYSDFVIVAKKTCFINSNGFKVINPDAIINNFKK